jgi:type VI secretion system secreted protein VgrG
MEQSIGPVTLQGPGAVDLAFRSMEFFEAVSTPFRYTVDVLSDKPDLAAETYLGKALSVILQIDEKGPRIFSGIITEFGLYGSIGQNTLYRLVLEPWLALLQLVSNCRIFQDKSVPDIVMDVFRKHGFSDIEPRLSVPHEPRPYVVQYRESDFNFVCRLLEDEGIYFFFQHAPGLHTLVLCDSLAAHKPAPGCDKLPYYPPDLNRTLHIDYIDRWQVNSRVESGAYGLRDFNFEDASAEKDATHEDSAQHPNGAFELYDYPGIYKAPGAGKVIAKRRLQEIQATRSRAEGHANARGLLVGALLTLEEHPVPSQNRQYLMLSLSGSVSTHALESGGDDVDIYVCNFECIDTKLPFQPPRRTPKPIVHGAQTAIVVGGANSEIFTDDYGRVLLMFHWDRDSPGNQDSSCWVRVAQAWAGSGFGAVFTPRVGHEVLVDFLEGDPDRPIVTGSVYNSDNKPPYLPLNASQSGIKTRSTLKGTTDNFNEIRFEDKKGEEQFFMQAEKDHTINVKNNRSATVGAADSISVGASRSETIDHDRTVKVGNAAASKSVVDVKGSHDVTATEYIKLEVKGTFIRIDEKSITLQVNGGGQIVIDTKVLAQAKEEGKLELTATAVMTAKEKAGITLSDKVLASSAGESKLQLDGDATLVGKGNASVSGTKKASFVGGEASQIDLEPAGATISSKKSKLNGEAMTEISGPVVKIN